MDVDVASEFRKFLIGQETKIMALRKMREQARIAKEVKKDHLLARRILYARHLKAKKLEAEVADWERVLAFQYKKEQDKRP